MSVILDALRSKEAANSATERLWPKEGLFVDVEKKASLSPGTRISILLVVLCAGTAFAVVRLSAMYFVTATQATPMAAVPVVASAPMVATKPEPIPDINLAKAFFAAGQLDESFAIYEQLHKMEPTNPMVLNDMGFILMKQNRVLEAESLLQEAISVAPDCAECFNNLGMLSTQMGRIAQAEKYLMRAIEINEIYAEPHFNLAVLLRKAGDEKSAMLHFEDYLKWTPNKSSQLAQQVRNLLDASLEPPAPIEE